MTNLTPEQRKALIEAVTARWNGYCDAFEREFEDDVHEYDAEYYLRAGWEAGVRWAEEQKAAATKANQEEMP